MIIVLDTNVLVSGFLSPFNAPGRIVSLVISGELALAYDTRILLEYQEVMLRSKFAFNPLEVTAVLKQIEAGGESTIASPLLSSLPDPSDEPFLEVAIASSADFLLTGNLKHYPASKRQGVTVLSPSEFMKQYR